MIFDMKLILGLGNPGKEYATTRHNAGFMALDALAILLETAWTKDAKRKAMIAKIKTPKTNAILAKPLTYMNESGQAARELINFYKIKGAENLLVAHDEMDFEIGRMAFAKNSGAAGHNGVQSIMDELGNGGFSRLRIGIGRPEKMKGEDWVLSEMDTDLIELIRERAPEALSDWMDKGFEQAATAWNKTGI